MKEKLDCATILHRAADRHRSEQKLVQAIQLYKRAAESYKLCGEGMISSVGLTYIEISSCLSELGEAELSDAYFLKARNIIRKKAELLFIEDKLNTMPVPVHADFV